MGCACVNNKSSFKINALKTSNDINSSQLLTRQNTKNSKHSTKHDGKKYFLKLNNNKSYEKIFQFISYNEYFNLSKVNKQFKQIVTDINEKINVTFNNKSELYFHSYQSNTKSICKNNKFNTIYDLLTNSINDDNKQKLPMKYIEELLCGSKLNGCDYSKVYLLLENTLTNETDSGIGSGCTPRFTN